jgi:hypothetical protein
MESGIEGAFLDPEDIVRNRLDMQGNAVAVERAASEGFENEEGECALEEVILGFEHGRSYR